MDGIRVEAIDSSLIFQIRLLSDDKGVGLWVCLCKIGFTGLLKIAFSLLCSFFKILVSSSSTQAIYNSKLRL